MPAAPVDLLDPGTALRRLHAAEAPYSGILHTGDPDTVWVDVACVPDALWRCGAEENLLVPVDLARSGRGHAAVVPHCPLRLAHAARSATSGATVTIAVSMLRAAAEARRHDLAFGTWWVDADGRPVLAATIEGPNWRDEAGAVFDALASTARGALAGALTDAHDLISRTRFTVDDAEACETRLFAAAEPTSLSAATHADTASEPPPRRADTVRRTTSAAVAPASAWLARLTDSAWADRVHDAVRAVGAAPARARAWLRRARPVVPPATTPRGDNAEPRERPRRPRRSVWLVAAGLGAAVLAVGLLWPDPGTTRDDSVAVMAEAADPSGDAAPAAGADGPRSGITPAGGSDLEVAAVAVLRALTDCAQAETCAELREDPGAAAPTGVVVADVARTVTLLDEYGGVAVFRVDAADQPAQILVLVSADGEWLVRDVYDVADQP